MKFFAQLALSTLTLAVLPATAFAQDKPAEKDAPAPERHVSPFDPRITDCAQQPTRSQGYDCERVHDRDYTIYLQNSTQQNDANEILVALRNLTDPSVKIFLISSQNAIAIHTYPEEFARAQAIVKMLDIAHKKFRITYTVTDMDGDKRVGTQHFSMALSDGQRSTLKQGSKIPVSTGSFNDGKGMQTQFTYLDVGINLDATITASANGLHLKSKVELSSAASDPVVIAGVSEPVIRQTVLDQVADLTLGKPTILGSVDIPGTTHRLDVAASIEPLP